jgi:hypothetical protein
VPSLLDLFFSDFEGPISIACAVRYNALASGPESSEIMK